MKQRRADIFVTTCAVLALLFVVPCRIPAATYEEDLTRARSLVAAKRHAEAEILLAKVAGRFPHNADILGMLGRVRVWLGKREEGLEDLRHALAIRDDNEVRQVVAREETADTLARARSLFAAGSFDEATSLAGTLFRGGTDRYGAGLLLAEIQAKRGDVTGASVTYGRVHDEYPANAEVAWLYVRSLLAAGKLEAARQVTSTLPDTDDPSVLLARANVALRTGLPREAAGLFRRSPVLREDAEVRVLLTDLDTRIAIEDADVLMAGGKITEAERVLRPLYDRGTSRYEIGQRLVRIARGRKDHAAAVELLSTLRQQFPDDGELLLAYFDVLLDGGRPKDVLDLMAEYPVFRDLPNFRLRRARALYRLRRYDDAVREYFAVGDISARPLADELDAAQNAALLETTVELMRSGRVAEAEAMWADTFPAWQDRNRDEYRLGMRHVSEKNYGKAVLVFDRGSAAFPSDTGLWALGLESRILDRDVPSAVDAIAHASPERRKYLETQREDLLYRVKPNFVKISALVSGYDNNLPVASEMAATVSRRFKDLSFSLTGGAYTRYGSTEAEAGGEATFPLGSRALHATAAATFSPGASFLPRYSVRGEATLSLRGGYEATLGYAHLSFRSSDADMIILGALGYITGALTLAERVYLVPASGSFATATTLHYENHRYRAFYTFGAGTASETTREAGGQLRYFTLSNRIGGEYRPVAEWSGGGEAFQEYRETLYSRYGGQIYLKYWW